MCPLGLHFGLGGVQTNTTKLRGGAANDDDDDDGDDEELLTPELDLDC